MHRLLSASSESRLRGRPPVVLSLSMVTAAAAALTLAPAASAASYAAVARVSSNMTYNSGSGATNKVLLSQGLDEVRGCEIVG